MPKLPEEVFITWNQGNEDEPWLNASDDAYELADNEERKHRSHNLPTKQGE